MHHGANDRIIMKCLTSDVLESMGKCQQTAPACAETITQHMLEAQLKAGISSSFLFFFSLSFSKRVKLPVKGQLLAALACGCLAPARALCWTQLGSRSSRCWLWGWRRERGHGPKQAVGTGTYRQLGENASVSSESRLLLRRGVRWNRFCGPPHSVIFSVFLV